MKMERILPFAKTLLKNAISPGDIVVDATLGNGHDTLFLADLVGETGKVYGFDVQQEAIEATKKRLIENHLLDRVTIFHAGHEHVSVKIPDVENGKITGAIFNLGYLPGGDKSIVTHSESTIAAIEQLLAIMAPKGIIVLVIYHGHEQGAVERDDLLEYCQKLDQKKAHVLRYQFINQQNNPPFILAIEKR
ncbi:class I SAM-dependent methyltransferase [Bacillus sp. USDA818B3_A]|uniref:class I SAM-dependent methyltransferase n=1 Tax=Bacillus sp. USDA818B3_A TaxID=2698834 RepID=UPI00136A2188|nr:class I SAM-dependent methyltransferase [Bacillus sp. USDA818B3_A]